MDRPPRPSGCGVYPDCWDDLDGTGSRVGRAGVVDGLDYDRSNRPDHRQVALSTSGGGIVVTPAGTIYVLDSAGAVSAIDQGHVRCDPRCQHRISSLEDDGIRRQSLSH